MCFLLILSFDHKVVTTERLYRTSDLFELLFVHGELRVVVHSFSNWISSQVGTTIMLA